MSETDINRRETGVRKLGNPRPAGKEAGAGQEGYREARETRPASNADLISRDAGDGSGHGVSPAGERERVEQGLDPNIDMTRHDALKEAARLGGSDTYLVDADMQDIDQRQDGDGDDGRPSPMANADNPER